MAKEKLISTNTLLYYHTAIKNLLAEKVDKVTGYSLMSDAEITRLSSVVNYDDTAVQSAISTMQGQISALESGTYDDTTLRNDIAATYATIANLEAHTDNADIHVTKTQKDSWDAKASQTDLDDLNTKVNNIVSNGVSFCGTVSTFADLPTDDVAKGDMYSITTAGTDGDGNAFLAGTNFVYDGTKWDNCGGTLDYAVIYTTGDMAVNSDIDTILNS